MDIYVGEVYIAILDKERGARVWDFKEKAGNLQVGEKGQTW